MKHAYLLFGALLFAPLLRAEVKNDAATPSDLRATSVEFSKTKDFSAGDKFTITVTIKNTNTSEDYDAENKYGVYVFTDYTNGAKVATLAEEDWSGVLYVNDIKKGAEKTVTFKNCTLPDLPTGWYRIYAGAGDPTQRIQSTYKMLYLRQADESNLYLAKIYDTSDSGWVLRVSGVPSFADNTAVPHKLSRLSFNVWNFEGGHFSGEFGAFVYLPNTLTEVGQLGNAVASGIIRYNEIKSYTLYATTDIAPGTYDLRIKYRKSSTSEWEFMANSSTNMLKGFVLLDDEDPNLSLTAAIALQDEAQRGANELAYSLYNDGGSYTGQVAAFLTRDAEESTRCSAISTVSIGRKQTTTGTLTVTLPDALVGGQPNALYLFIRRDADEQWTLLTPTTYSRNVFTLPLKAGASVENDSCY